MHPSALDKVRQLRFEGYTVGMLALEIDLLREGRGTGSMTNAVTALTSVATALRNTDETLRVELGKLGVEWQSTAASTAHDVMQTSADFAEDASGKLSESSQAAFGLSEAFQRALHTLPDSRTLRDGAEGLSTMDVLADLIGHETDHAAKVRAASAARDQAVDALNQLASTCAEELACVRKLGEPGAIVLDEGRLPPALPDDGVSAGYQTMAAAAESVSGPEPRPGGLPTSPVQAGPPPSAGSGASGVSGASGANTTTGGRPAGGGERPPSGGSGSDGSGSGSGGSGGGSDGSGGGSGPVGGMTGPLTGSAEGRSGSQASTASVPGGSAGSEGFGSSCVVTAGGTTFTGGVPTAPGGASGIAGIAAGSTVASASVAAPVAGTALGGITTTDVLGTGALSGAMPQNHPQTTLAPGATTTAPLDEDGIAGAVTAIGAAGVAGAMSAEPDRERRRARYDVDDTDETSRHEFDVGTLEDEAEADAVAEIEPDAGQDAPAYLEHAAPQGPADARVRTHGIDDADLFADDRMVARDTIGEEPAHAYRDDPDDPQDRP